MLLFWPSPSFTRRSLPLSAQAALEVDMAALSGLVIAWDVLMFLAILLLVLALVPPLFSRRVMRRKTWHTLMLSLLVFSIGQVFLVGNQTSTSPSPNICLVQVALFLSTPPFLGASTLSYSADIYISIRRMFESNDWEDGPEPQNVVILVLAPWIFFLLVFLAVILVVGLSENPPDIASPRFYCRTQNTAAVMIAVVTLIITMLCSIGLQAATGWTLYHNWIKTQKVSITSTTRRYFHTFIRTIAFTALAVIGVALGSIAAATVKGRTMVGFSMLLPIFPIGAALIFGTYQDIVSFYMFWR